MLKLHLECGRKLGLTLNLCMSTGATKTEPIMLNYIQQQLLLLKGWKRKKLQAATWGGQYSIVLQYFVRQYCIDTGT